MLSYLKSAWDSVVAFFKGKKPKPDPRPDPEDPIAYAHLEKVLALQDSRASGIPLQLLKDRTKRPTDTNEDWITTQLDHPPGGYDCWVDNYGGPLGVGYVVNYEVKRGQVTWHKAINIGPEEWREQDWTEVAVELPEQPGNTKPPKEG